MTTFYMLLYTLKLTPGVLHFSAFTVQAAGINIVFGSLLALEGFRHGKLWKFKMYVIAGISLVLRV